jgi:hypothetical protein
MILEPCMLAVTRNQKISLQFLFGEDVGQQKMERKIFGFGSDVL